MCTLEPNASCYAYSRPDRGNASRPRSSGAACRGLDETTLLRLRRLAYTVCPGQSFADREDLIQEAALKLVRLTAADGSRRLETAYLARTLRSVAIDEARRRARCREVPGSDAVEGVTTIDSEQLAVASRLRAQIVRAMEGVSESRRPLVLLRLEGFSIRECANRMAIDPKRAENLIYRGLSQLREELNRMGACS